jgi:hypothetical protein
MSRRRRRGSRGQSLIIVALAFTLFLVGVICLVADAAVLFRWSARVQAAAQVAAESGADSVSPSFLYGASQPCPAASGAPRCSVAIVDIDPQDRRAGLYAFERACIQAGDQSAAIARSPEQSQQPDGTACDADGCRVVAVVTRWVALPIPVPGFPPSLPVRGEFRAAPVVGTERPAAACVGSAWVPATPSPASR